jgi:hypothetical protein
MVIEIDMGGAPESEFCRDFVVGMAKRMAMSYYKYGLVSDAYPHKVDAIRSLQARLDKYAQTGNTEYLMDAGNFAMIEFMYPKHPAAYFESTDSSKSPGRTFHGEIDRSQRGNKEI